MVNSLRYLILVPVLCAGCERLAEYRKPISLTPHGAAVRANMAAHIINPRPPTSKPPRTDGQRPALANERYRTDQVKEPETVATSPKAAAQE